MTSRCSPATRPKRSNCNLSSSLNRQQLDQQQRDLLHRERLLERQQANAVDFAVWPSENLPGKPPFCLALVTNSSDRPIRDVRCRIDMQDPNEKHLMTWIGYQTAYDKQSPKLGTWYRPEHRDTPFAMMRGRIYGFEFDLHNRHDRHWKISVRFTDDAGLHWQIDSELHLEKLDGISDW
jgi:hypothetical protein